MKTRHRKLHVGKIFPNNFPPPSPPRILPAAHLTSRAGRVEASSNAVPRDNDTMILGSHGVETQRLRCTGVDLHVRTRITITYS